METDAVTLETSEGGAKGVAGADNDEPVAGLELSEICSAA